MLAPLSWLKEYVDIDVTPQELEKKLLDCGFEVEELTELGKDIHGVVVGYVEQCDPIPDTHLHLCRVSAGKYGTFQVCCGADNVCAGKKYPLALVGAQVIETAKDHVTVLGTTTIRKGKLRGYDSDGMLCSGTELGLTEDMYPGAGYNGLLVLPDDVPAGEDVKPIVGLDDWIYDISITANRPDAMSILGISREIAAALGKPLKMPALDYTETDVENKGFHVTVEAPELCPRYVAHYVYDVKIGESPAWMRRRLHLVGNNAINNIVDITNYVMREIGQPMHAFNGGYLRENCINVRRAADGEKITTLDGKTFTLGHDNLVICDGEGPVALAGIMGGQESEVQADTTSITFESATFARDNIRKTSRALGQVSDASAAYSKGVYEYTSELAMRRALHLVEELGAGRISRTHVDINTGNSIGPRPMEASIDKINGVLGITVPTEDIRSILERLDFAPEIDGDRLTIQVPAYRQDMESYPDIAEEVIRMYGYDHVKPTFLKDAQVTVGGRNRRQKAILKLKRALCAQGADECMHYSFFSPADLDLLRLPEKDPAREAIRLINPINEDLSLMRTTLVPQMIRAAARNQKKNNMEGRLYEIGSRFIPKSLPLTDYPDERTTLCIGVWGKEEDFFTLKGLVDTVADTFLIHFDYQAAEEPYLHPYRCAAVLCDGKEIGCLGQVRYEIGEDTDMTAPVYVAELDLDSLAEYDDRKPVFKPLPKFPAERRDLALVMDRDIPCAEVESIIRSACRFVTEVRLFDEYEGPKIGPGRKQLAFTVTFTPEEEEFTPQVVQGYVDKILRKLKVTRDITMRS